MKLITLLFALVGISSSAVAANEKIMLRGVKNLPFLQEGAPPDRTGTADESGVCTEDADCGDGCNCDTNLADANSVCGARGNKGCCLCWSIQPVTDATKPATPVTGATAVIQTFPTDGDYLGDEDVVQEEEEVDEIRSEMKLRGVKNLPFLQEGAPPDRSDDTSCRDSADCDDGCDCDKTFDDPRAECGATGQKGCCVCSLFKPATIPTAATKPASTATPVTGATAVIQTFPTDGDYLGDEENVEHEEDEVDEIRSEMNELLKVFPHLQGARHGFCQNNNDCGGNKSGCSCNKNLPTDQCDPPDTNPSSGCCVCE